MVHCPDLNHLNDETFRDNLGVFPRVMIRFDLCFRETNCMAVKGAHVIFGPPVRLPASG